MSPARKAKRQRRRDSPRSGSGSGFGAGAGAPRSSVLTGASGSVHSSPAGEQASGRLERAVWERSMSRLRLCNRILTVVLLALAARALLSGFTPAVELTAMMIAVLLLASVLLTVHGRGLDPDRAARPDARPEPGEPG